MSITKTSAAWVVAHLYYDQPWLNFLTKSVKPFVDSLTKSGIIERYYFERSQDRGAHIRLYFRCNEELLRTLVLPNLRKHFAASGFGITLRKRHRNCYYQMHGERPHGRSSKNRVIRACRAPSRRRVVWHSHITRTRQPVFEVSECSSRLVPRSR